MERDTHKIGTIYKPLWEKWKNSTSGTTMLCEKGGKKYFVKRYNNNCEPVDNGAYTPKLFAKQKAKFENYIAIRESINKEIRSFSSSGGDIIIPVEEFVEDHFYTEVSEFIEGCVSEEDAQDVILSLSMDARKKLLVTATGALNAVHERNIVHSDLKLKNILLVKNASGSYVAKLIDFDNSYFLDKIPEYPGGDIFFYSPELALLARCEDLEERGPFEKQMTTKSDIFSLGIIFHFYLTGEYPTYSDLNPAQQKAIDSGKIVSPAAILLGKGKVNVSHKITDSRLYDLISSMLSLDYEKRPSAQEVYTTLLLPPKKGDMKSEEKPSEPKKVEPKKEEPKKVETPSGFEEPWPEHKIVFDLEYAKTRSVCAIKRATVSGKNGYTIYFTNGAALFFTKEQAVAMKYAKAEAAPKKEVSSGFDEPWPEHKIVFDHDAIKAKNYVSMKREEVGGRKVYAFFDVNGDKIYLDPTTCVILKMAKRL